MAIVLVKSLVIPGASSVATSLAGTWPSTTTVGNTIIIGFVNNSALSANVTGITDNSGNTYTKVFSQPLSVSNDTELWTAPITTAGSSTITVAFTTAGPACFIAREYSGLLSPAIDVSTSGTTASGTGPSSPATGTITATTELVIGIIGIALAGEVFTAGSGYANIASTTSTAAGTKVAIAMEDKLVSARGAQSSAFILGSSSTSSIGVATYKTFSDLFTVLTENFDDNICNTAKWNQFTGGTSTISRTSGQLILNTPSLTTGSNYAGYDSVYSYNLTGSSLYAQVPQMVSTTTNAQCYMKLYLDGSNSIQFIQQNGTINVQKTVAGVTTNLNAGATYNLTTHQWWRFRESGGSTFFDFAPDGVTWTNFGSFTNPFAVTALTLEMSAGTFQSETSPGSATFDYINTAPAANISHNLTLLGIGS